MRAVPACPSQPGVPDDIAEKVGKTIQYYAIFSSQEVKPAYYNIMLTSRNIRDAESGEMLDPDFPEPRV